MAFVFVLAPAVNLTNVRAASDFEYTSITTIIANKSFYSGSYTLVTDSVGGHDLENIYNKFDDDKPYDYEQNLNELTDWKGLDSRDVLIYVSDFAAPEPEDMNEQLLVKDAGSKIRDDFGQYHFFIVTIKEAPGIGFIAYDDALQELIHVGGSDILSELNSGTKITTGRFIGGVFPGDDWKSDVDTITKGKVSLVKVLSDGTLLPVYLSDEGTPSISQESCKGASESDFYRKVTDTPIQVETQGYVYNSIDVACTADGGIYEGTYRLYYFWEEGGDFTGNASVGMFKSMISTVQFIGYIEFNIVAKDEKNATISYNKNSGPNEARSAELLNNGEPTKEVGFFIDVSENSSLETTASELLSNAATTMLAWLQGTIQWGSRIVIDIINDSNDFMSSAGLRAVWIKSRNISLSLLTLALLIIAFTNILSINMDRFAASRMVPRMIITILMVFFSFLMIGALLEVASALQNLMVGDMSSFGALDFSGKISSVGDIAALSFDVFLMIIAALIAVISFIFLILVLLVRKAVLYFLIGIAPIAFIMNLMPFTEFLNKQWWSRFWKWAFMGPAVVFFLYIANSFLGGFGTASQTSEDSPIIFILIGAICIFLAASIPLQLGGEIYGAIQKHGGKVWGNKHNPIKNRLDMARKSKDEARSLNLRKKQAKLAQRKGIGFLSGMNKTQAIAAREGLKGDIQKEYAKYDRDKLVELAKGKGLGAEAAQDMLADNSMIDTKDAELMGILARRATTDGGFASRITKNQREAWSAMAVRLSDEKAGKISDATRTLVDRNAASAFEGLKAEDFKAEHFEFLAKNHPQRLASLMGDTAFNEALMTKGSMKSRAAYGEAINQAMLAQNKEVFSAYDRQNPHHTNAERAASQWTSEHDGKNIF